MSSLVTTLTETLRYRGAIGQWSWVLHRLAGLGVVVFLLIHVIDTSWAVLAPDLYEEAIASYQTPIFTIGEFILIAALIYHGYNGLRIILLDYRPRLWRYQQRAAVYVLIAAVVTLIPVFILMLRHVVDYYGSDRPIMSFLDVIETQIPFVIGVVAAIVAALALSLVTRLIAGGDVKKTAAQKTGSNLERFWWSFMRISGLLIILLAGGHLLIIHIIQGVFELNVAGAEVVGTNVINSSGTAAEFAGNRWNYLLAGVAIWRIYDLGLLVLAVLHGFNGLRYVLTDYTMSSPLLRRAMVYLCVIGMVALLVVGGYALFATVDDQAIRIAEEARLDLLR